jgi:ABC-type bacteriocin/lantibiotic exporter with double-glycine peptidase domain
MRQKRKSPADETSIVNLITQLWSVLTARQRRWVLIAQGASLLMALSTVAGIAAISPFFAVLAEPRLIDQSPPLLWLYGHLGLEDRRSFVVALGVGFVAMVLLTNIINLLGSYALLRLALWIGDDLRTVLFTEYLNRNLLFHSRTNSTTIFSNIVNATNRVAVGILQSLFTLVTSAVTAAVIIVSILLVNPIVAITVVIGLIGGYFLIYFTLRHKILSSGQIESELSTNLARFIFEGFGAIKEIIVLRRHAFFEQRFRLTSRALSRLAAYIGAITQSPKHVIECIAVAGLVSAALVLSRTDGGIGRSLAQLTFLGFAVYRLLPALQQGFASVVQIRAARAGFIAIAADLLQARKMVMEPVPLDPAWHARPEREITLTNISFRYSPHMPPVLHELTLGIPAGAMLGVVGSNGSGKSTLVDVLAGLLVPDAGQVQIDGIILDEVSRAQWQSRIAYVPQSIFLADATIAENVALGIAPSDIDQERLLSAARLARLDAFVNTLPKGYREQIGERGVRLSGGQRQRVGIARALYADASVLIMDEATNSLDVFAEAEVMAAVEALRGRKTIVLIAHRLNTLRRCDLLVEIEAGAVVRTGTWAEFARHSNRFAMAAQAHALPD